MQMKQCPNGHFFDQSIHKECPYCTGGAGFGGKASGGIEVTVPVPPAGSDVTHGPNFTDSPDGVTQPGPIKKIGIDPVVGWLVCVEGGDKGKDYRIHSDNNFIGRAPKMDICISNDDTISRENPAMVSFDSLSNAFYLSKGNGRNIVYHNGKAVFETVTLKNYDTIQLGSTKLVFIALCGEEFSWLE